MDQKDHLLQHIGASEGRVITADLARHARDLAGAPAVDPVVALMIPQLCILLLRDLGGERKYTAEEIDDETSGLILKLQVIKYKGKDGFRFCLEKR